MATKEASAYSDHFHASPRSLQGVRHGVDVLWRADGRYLVNLHCLQPSSLLEFLVLIALGTLSEETKEGHAKSLHQQLDASHGLLQTICNQKENTPTHVRATS